MGYREIDSPFFVQKIEKTRKKPGQLFILTML